MTFNFIKHSTYRMKQSCFDPHIFNKRNAHYNSVSLLLLRENNLEHHSYHTDIREIHTYI